MVGCLNNEAREPNEYRFRQFGLREYFQVALSSCYLGMRKPEGGDLSAALWIFWDGRESGCYSLTTGLRMSAGAAKVGMKAIRFDGADALRRIWRH